MLKIGLIIRNEELFFSFPVHPRFFRALSQIMIVLWKRSERQGCRFFMDSEDDIRPDGCKLSRAGKDLL